MGHFIENLETNKLELHFSKAEYNGLTADLKSEIKSTCLWAKSVNAWVSRAKLPAYRCRELAKKLNLEDRGQEGERLTFAEQLEVKQDRAENRADRMENRAEANASEAHSRFNSSNVQAVRDLQGEPIKIGHHSEKRHRRLIDKADRDMDKGCEALDKAKHYRQRADAARATADGKEYSDPAFLGRRIKEDEAEQRLLKRRFEESTDDAYKARLTVALEEVEDRLGFYRHCLETCGKVIYNKASLKGKTAVKIRGHWELIVKLNPTTVAVPNICFRDEEAQRKWALKYPYSEVQDAR